MDGFSMVTMEKIVHEFNIITLAHMKKVTNKAIEGNTGHFGKIINMDGLEGFAGIYVQCIKPQADRFEFPDCHV